MKKYIVLALCVAVLSIVLASQVLAQPEINSTITGKNHPQQPGQGSVHVNSALPDANQNNAQMSETPRPEIWFGLIISLVGAAVFWLSVLWMGRRRAYKNIGHIKKISF